MNIQESQTKISFEAESGNLLERITKSALKEFIKDTGIEDPVYYYTFLENDYDRKIIRLVVTDSLKNRTALTIPEDDEEAEKAWNYFLKLNSHLNIFPKISFGYNGNDFIYNRVTTKVFFESRNDFETPLERFKAKTSEGAWVSRGKGFNKKSGLL